MNDSNRARRRKRVRQSADASRNRETDTRGVEWEGHWTRNDFQSDNEYAWALYLRLMCFRWEYRPQAFVLQSRPICPTFWFPDHQCWLFVQDEPTPTAVKFREVRSVVDATNFPAGIVSTCGTDSDWHLVVGGDDQPKGVLLIVDGLSSGSPFALGACAYANDMARGA